jgi:hypothetical protein
MNRQRLWLGIMIWLVCLIGLAAAASASLFPHYFLGLGHGK